MKSTKYEAETTYEYFLKNKEISFNSLKYGETMFELTNKQKMLLIVACFAYSGIALLFALISFYMIFNDGQMFFIQKFLTGRALPLTNLLSGLLNSISWVTGLFSLFGAIITFFAGSALIDQTSHESKEVKTKKEIPYSMLLPDEKELINILKQNDNIMTQNELVKASGLSKVKIHRVLKKLETKKIISKYAYGMTNKIRLEKGFTDDTESS